MLSWTGWHKVSWQNIAQSITLPFFPSKSWCHLFSRSAMHNPPAVHMIWKKWWFIRPSHLFPLLWAPVLTVMHRALWDFSSRIILVLLRQCLNVMPWRSLYIYKCITSGLIITSCTIFLVKQYKILYNIKINEVNHHSMHKHSYWSFLCLSHKFFPSAAMNWSVYTFLSFLFLLFQLWLCWSGGKITDQHYKVGSLVWAEGTLQSDFKIQHTQNHLQFGRLLCGEARIQNLLLTAGKEASHVAVAIIRDTQICF